MKVARRVLAASLVIGLAAGCSSTQATPDEEPVVEHEVEQEAPEQEEVVEELATLDVLQAIADGDHRSEQNRVRNQYRNPADTLDFFGIAPGMTVVELSPGRGWYTEVLAPFLAEEGHLTVGSFAFDPEDTEAYRTQIGLEYQELLEAQAEVFGDIRVGTFEPPETVDIGEPESADMIVSFRSMHGWYNREVIDDVFAFAFETLKPGGVFGVVQHRAAEGADPAETSPKGYLPQEFVIERAEQAGFVLEDASEINANPRDTRDYEEGVWALPPSLRSESDDQSRFEEIGESDRMTLRFVKPAAPAESAESAEATTETE